MKPSRRLLAATITGLLGLTPLTLAATAYADTPAPTSITEHLIDTIAPGEGFSTAFNVQASASLDGESVHITRFDATHPDGEALPDATVFGANAVSLSDTAPMNGALSYRIDYPGDAQDQATSATFTMPVAKYAPRMLITAPTAVARNGLVTISGGLATHFPFVHTGQVRLARADPAHPASLLLETVPVAADGTFTLNDTPTTGGTNSYTLTYDGGTSYLPVTQTVTVQVTRADTTVTVHTDQSVYNYGGWAKITAHLGTTYNGRTVTVYAHPAGGSWTTVKTGTVDANGNLTAWYKLTHNTTFGAAFTGDYRYNPASAVPATVYTHAAVTDTMLQRATTTRIGNTTYNVYMRDTPLQPLLKTAVTPDHSGQGLTVVLQRYWAGSWHTISTNTSYHLKSYSTVYIPLPWGAMPNYALYRVVAEYTHDNTDTSNIDTWGNWQYFTIHPHP